ncbi:MAG TPA: urease accessory protein UreE [Candidatus Blautia stercoravium]|nr:urease accessory protein UreE [Candidatus Blautia stercoravium]
MLCENIWGNLKDTDTTGKKIDYVEFEWDEAFKRIHKKVSREGKEVGIRLDDSVLTKGIRTGDILWQEGDALLAAKILPCKVIEVKLAKGHEKMGAKVCYEIGNRHAVLLWGEEEDTFLTPYTQPVLEMLEKIHGVKAEVKEQVLDFDKRISASINSHTH